MLRLMLIMAMVVKSATMMMTTTYYLTVPDMNMGGLGNLTSYYLAGDSTCVCTAGLNKDRALLPPSKSFKEAL